MTYNTENPLRVVTLCSVYDSHCLALERLKRDFPPFDYKLLAWSEFDPESTTPIDRQPAVYALDLQFGKINYVDDTICYSLHTRISASQKSFIVIIDDD